MPMWADAMGPTSFAPNGRAIFSPSGAPQMRNQLFSYLGGQAPQMQSNAQTLASGLTSAAGSPVWGQAQDLAKRTMAGDYLAGSPQLNQAMAANTAQTMAGAQDQVSREQSNMAREGMAFSTGNQQAAQATMAKAAADAGRTNAGTMAGNYLQERGNQAQAPAAFQQAQSAPLNYLGQISSALTNPASQEGQILSALSGGNVITPVTNTAGQYNPSMGANIMGGLGSVMGMLGGGGGGGSGGF